MPNCSGLLLFNDLRSCLAGFVSEIDLTFREVTISIGDSEVVKRGCVAGLLSSNGICVLTLLRDALVVRTIFELG